MNKRILVLLTAPCLVLAPVGLTFAQTQGGGEAQTREAPTIGAHAAAPDAFGHRRGFGGPPFGRPALGTPASGAESTQTLTFTYGEDSEAAFAEAFAAARAEAAYLTAEIGEQTETLELNTTGTDGNAQSDRADFGRGFGRGLGRGLGYGGLPLGGLNRGSSVTATFYDGDPAGNGQELQTLTFTYAESSAAGFAADYAAAAAEAAYVVVTTSPQSYTVPLTEAPLGFDGFGGRGRGDRGGFGDGFGPDGFGPGRSR